MGDDGASDTVPIAEWQMEALGATPSPYLKAYRARFLDRRDQQRKTWDLLLAHDSVSIIVSKRLTRSNVGQHNRLTDSRRYHRDQDALLLVKQFRPAVYASGLARANGAATASTLLESFTYELCAGLLDKPHLNVAETAREEIIEELGFDVRVDDIELVTTYHNSVGLLGTVSTLMYAEVRSTRLRSRIRC